MTQRGRGEACCADDEDTPDEWLPFARAAKRLDIRERHLRALVARGEIPHCKLGRLVRFHWPTLERWLLAANDAGAPQ